LEKVFARIGNPDSDSLPRSLSLDALRAIQKTDCLVTAPTGAGKTWIAEKAIEMTMNGTGAAGMHHPSRH
jgi:superfamily II DNA or RNA helicase